MKKVIGILGGMGPGATADAFSKLVMHTPAACDQEHIPVIIASIPDIPDRTENLIHDGPSPLPSMIKSLKMLDEAGASCIIMPCNTAHYWYEDLKQKTNSEFISIIDSTCEKVTNSGDDSVAILATTATIKTRLYQDKLKALGVNYIIPDDVNQQKIMHSIMSYKAGEFQKSYELMASYVRSLEYQGVSRFIMGCTEIPLILKPVTENNPDRFIDATEELIKKAISWYYENKLEDGLVLS